MTDGTRNDSMHNTPLMQWTVAALGVVVVGLLGWLVAAYVVPLWGML